jgi:hypothetical protein
MPGLASPHRKVSENSIAVQGKLAVDNKVKDAELTSLFRGIWKPILD